MGSKIAPPRSRRDYVGRQSDCEAALEETFAKLLNEARIAGWLEGETAVAMRQLAKSHLGWLLAANDTEAALSAKRALEQIEMKKTPWSAVRPRS